MVVFVAVGFPYMSIFRLEGFLIIRRSRKFVCPLVSYVGCSCRFVCIRLKYSWIALSFMCVLSYMIRMSSTYLVY
jgi:hypothetical protein